jgi:class 3 adenylate cyclase
MIAYPSARRGLQCAVDMQRNLARLDEAELGELMRVRIGLHTGAAIREGDDLYGRSVTLAARLGGEAGGGEILTSSIVRDLVGSSADVSFEDAGELELKGLRGSHHVYRVVWEQPERSRRSLRAVG